MKKNVKKGVVVAAGVAGAVGAAIVAAKKCCKRDSDEFSGENDTSNFGKEKKGRTSYTTAPLSKLLENSR